MEQGKLIISQSNNITCIAGRAYSGKTKHIIHELKKHITDGQTIKPFIFVSPELNDFHVQEFIKEDGIQSKGFFIDSVNTKQTMNQIFDECITLMRNTGIQVMAFDNIPKINAMDIIQLYNKLKEEKDLYFLFSHHVAIQVADALEEINENRIADIKWNMV